MSFSPEIQEIYTNLEDAVYPRVVHHFQLRYDLPLAGEYIHPVKAIEWFCEPLKTHDYCGTWNIETTTKAGIECKPHLHFHFAVESRKPYKMVKKMLRNHVDKHGKAAGWHHRPLCYSLGNTDVVEDTNAFFRYPLKMVTENPDTHIWNTDMFCKLFPGFNVQVQHELAREQCEEAGQRSKAAQEKRERKTVLQVLLEQCTDTTFTDVREVFDFVLNYHHENKLNIDGNKMRMYTDSIAYHKKLLTASNLFEKFYCKF